ncbi:MAG TPA: polysaccharide deacetylase family protein [Methylomusa anaerophila]|uniref:Poly-beta-1,6-N-acetyl-D-glucosamine N-deacetylase n=1 Tax=Methylomusa anaerophila TaxID=1930071 RepID=A0A348ALL7_9FIRM|nr:polysaccharide deacetylase family protein [Methylomusa anaerophila]BBB91965.1 poly-beta-1,6-N-acetyl-D-glucosamine N-deacetylase precursor [Methylomusa anaerophila]HML88023.1 polysaccharide deacetylase family protein [Methylomusa anaerophila]
MNRTFLGVIIVCGLVTFGIIGIYFYVYGETDDLSSGIPVLNYHGVEDNVNNPLALEIKDFEDQMAYLHTKGYTAITPDQLLDYLSAGKKLPDKPVLITFDDGYANNYTNAYPILKKYGFTAVFFLITDVIGHDPWYMNWDQVKEMRQQGFQFGSHTLSHADLTKVPVAQVNLQLVKSREGIEWRLNTPVRYLAYPGGAYDSQIEKLVLQAGYKAAFSVKFGRVQKGGNLLALERIPLFKSRWTFLDFYLRLNFTKAMGKIKAVKDRYICGRELSRR